MFFLCNERVIRSKNDEGLTCPSYQQHACCWYSHWLIKSSPNYMDGEDALTLQMHQKSSEFLILYKIIYYIGCYLYFWPNNKKLNIYHRNFTCVGTNFWNTFSTQIKVPRKLSFWMQQSLLPPSKVVDHINSFWFAEINKNWFWAIFTKFVL